MKRFFSALCLLTLVASHTFAQQPVRPHIEPRPSKLIADPRLIVKSGYLVVPENRHKRDGRQIKVPFLFARRPDQDARKNISLFSTGGPGYAMVSGVDTLSYDSGWLKFGGIVIFDQRGTKDAQPCLKCNEVAEAVRESYREGKDRKSLVLQAVKKCRNRLTKQGIDLSGYNTTESAEDINDLRLALDLDSLNLVGISYSGGLMLTVARNHPEAVSKLILNSPLPGFVNFEEHALLNTNEALENVFADCEKDSTATRYTDLRLRFHRYFSAITGQKFKLPYQEEPGGKTYTVTYTKDELLKAVVSRLNSWQVKSVPAVIVDLIDGKHAPYVKEVLDGAFAENNALALGMRYSVYCSEQIAYADIRLQKKQDALLPWLSGLTFNDVDHPICSCWNVKPVSPVAKTPVYSNVPAIISAGDIDPDCRPFYNRLIKRYLPNAQLLILHNKGHAPGFKVGEVDYVKMFMEHPFKRLVSSDGVIVE